MTIDLVFAALLIGHVLGDFYLQTNSVAQRKDSQLRPFTMHILIYTACMGITLLVAIPFSATLFCLWLASSFLHFLIDLIKKDIKNQLNNATIGLYLKKHSLIIDQLLHIVVLIAIWYFFGSHLTVRPFVGQDVAAYPYKPILILLCFLCILRPIGILIGKGELWDFKKHNVHPVTSVQNAGRMIGYLERIIVMFFLMYQQFGAIAFILTAKSVARFKEIESNKEMAEYYLIGTLLSVVSVFIIVFLLGLCNGS